MIYTFKCTYSSSGSWYTPGTSTFTSWDMPGTSSIHSSSYGFPAFLGGGFCCSVILSRRYTPPPRSLRAWSMRFPLACCLLALLMLTYHCFFLLVLPFFDFDLDIVCFHPVFFLWVLLCCLLGFGFCCDSFIILYIYVCILIRTYADCTLFFVWCIRFVSVIVCIIFCFYLFSSFGNFPLQSYWRLSCDHGLHCSDELL